MTIQPFSQVADLDSVYVASKGKLSCFAFRLRNGDLSLYSPVAGLEENARDTLAKLGGVSVMLAPNHYHNKGLKGHADAFPDAALVCSKGAEPRLKKITGLVFGPINTLKSQMAENHRLLEPEGLKTGEIWIEIRTPSQTAWIVTDAFTAKRHPPGVCADAPDMLGTFPRYGVKDASVFKDWVSAQLSASPPTMLLSCHGSPVHAPDLDAQLRGLLTDTF